MDDWRRLTIGDLCDAGVATLQTGPFGSQLHAADYRPTGIPVVPTEAIRNRQIDHSVLPKISKTKAEELRRHFLLKGDILFARRGAQATGQTGFIRDAEVGFICGTGAIRLRIKSGNEFVRQEFLSHVFRNNASVEWFKFHAIGATMPNLNEGIIRSFPLSIPSLYEQDSISRLLSAMDDKIELNRQMNETLEAMARAIFKDWFVDFGPTRAKMAGTKPYLAADIWKLFPDKLDDHDRPEGWSIRPLDQIAHFLNGLALQKYPALDGHFLPVIKISQLRAANCLNSDRTAINIPNEYIVEDGDVLFSWSGSLMQRVWTAGRGALNQHLFKVTSNIVPKWFYFYWIDHHMESFRATAASKATTMGHIQRHHLAQAMTIVPSDQVLELADKTVGPIFERIISNELENRTLAATRDLLLPKLMSGEIGIKDAETITKPMLAIAS